MEKVALMTAVAGLFIFAMGVISARKTREIHKVEIRKNNEVAWLDPRPKKTTSPSGSDLAMSMAAEGTGNVSGSAVSALNVVPVTVKSKRKCDTCGKVNKPSEKFCGECGTALTVI